MIALKGTLTIYNEYGPTETVVGCMIYKFDAEKDTRISVPIGKPADNVQIYLLDKYLILYPMGHLVRCIFPVMGFQRVILIGIN